ncbi:MAG: flagellar biosynthesis protein FlhB [Solirubrobacteraceae bacterium]
MAAGEKTEKATPKKLDDARKKGQVARSIDLNGAVVLMAAVLALSAFGPMMLERMQEAMVAVLQLTSSPAVVDRRGVGSLFGQIGIHVGLAAAPLVGVCALAGVIVNVLQVGIKPAPAGVKPDVKKLNPITGAKNLFGPNMIAEALKSIAKVGAVGGIVALAVFPKLEEVAGLLGMPAAELLPHLATEVLHVAQRAALAYLVIAAADTIYQRWRFAKQMRMDKQEVKDEHKQQELPAEVRGMQRRRGMELANARMMDAVPTADVIVTNPTHFSVALRYDSEQPAPVVVAKGRDHLALRIRALAAERGVAVVPDPPLARSLYATVEVGRMIPEELYQAVAQLLAYVYRVAGAARAGAA